jgi:hypothetical protein
MKIVAPVLICVFASYLWWQFQAQEKLALEQPIPIPILTISFVDQELDQATGTAPTTNLTSGVDNTNAIETQAMLQSSLQTNSENDEASENIPTETQIETTPSTIQTPSCSSPDNPGLAHAFERELSGFLNNAAATYGAQYSNLQYSISNQVISQNENMGTVSSNYQGSVTEISSGETISASGGMTVNFSWDGCQWLLVDYSYF